MGRRKWKRGCHLYGYWEGQWNPEVHGSTLGKFLQKLGQWDTWIIIIILKLSGYVHMPPFRQWQSDRYIAGGIHEAIILGHV